MVPAGRLATAVAGALLVLCAGLSMLTRARASASTRSSAEVSVTIVAPLPYVSVLEVMPPLISANGTVLIHVNAADWLSLPTTSGEGLSTEAASMVTTTPHGTLREGLATSVTGSSASSNSSQHADRSPWRIVVEFN